MTKKNIQGLGNLTQRILSVSVLIPLLLFVTAYPPEWFFGLFLLGVILIAMFEFYRLLELKGIKCFNRLGMVLAVILTLAFGFGGADCIAAVLSFSILICLSYGVIYGREPTEAYPAAVGTLFGVFYIAFFLNHLFLLRKSSYGSESIILLLLLIWACDSGAYFIGRYLGRHKLSPVISPGKTVEGAVGGVVFSVIAAIICRGWFSDVGVFDAVFLGLTVAVVAQLGDLFESQLKRFVPVKDSGFIIPGHGG